jgi:tetratricopeptide (TPR) repeat protein
MSTNAGELSYWEAQRLAAEGKLEAGLELLKDVPEAHPEAAILRGRILAQMGRFAEAAESFRKALTSEPGNLNARAGLASVEALSRGPFSRLRLYTTAWLAAGVTLLLICIVAWVFTAAFRTGGGSREQIDRLDATERRLEVLESEQQAQLAKVKDGLARLDATLDAQSRLSARSQGRMVSQIQALRSQVAALRSALPAQNPK